MTLGELEQKIIDAAQKYYEGTPIMSDNEFDALIAYLRAANPTSPILTQVGWGYDPYKNIGEKEQHLYGDVIGIDRKPRDISEIPQNFFTGNILKSAKLDGGSVICYFMNGKMTKALTRGKGNIGINKTNKIAKVLEKELALPDGFDFTGAIRGEFCISNENWKEMLDKGIVSLDANQRNVAVGYLNRDEIPEEIKYCDIVFYKVVGYANNNNNFNNVYINNILNNNAFDVRFLRKFIKEEYIVEYKISENGSGLNQESLEELYNKFKDKYLCDGVVISKGERTALRVEDKYLEKWSIVPDEIAYKFEDEIVETEIEAIRWKMSKGNKAIPVINVKPVPLSGVTVSNATAFNAKYVYDNDLDVGSKVELLRSGEVIPYISKVISGSNGEGRKKLDEMTCPYCGTKLSWDGVDLVCTNKECANRDFQNLRIWVNNVAPIDGMSETLNFKFFEEKGIDSLENLYNHSYGDLMFSGEASNTHKGKFNLVLDKLFNQEINFTDLLVALNIKMLGVKNADKLAHNDEFIALFKEFLEVEDIELFVSKATPVITKTVGQAMAANICSADGLTKIKNAKYVQHRINYEHDVKEELIPVVITGKLSVPRKEFETYLNEHGYEVKGAVNKDTKYLITDNPNSSSSKNKKADELGIIKITEQEIRNIIDDDELSKNNISKNDIL